MRLGRRHQHVARRGPGERHPLQPQEGRRPLGVGHLQRQRGEHRLVRRFRQVEQRVDQLRVLGRGDQDHALAGMRRHHIVGARDRGRAEQPRHRLGQRCRMRGDDRAGADAEGAVRVHEPGRAPHRRRRQMLAGEQAEPGRVRRRKQHVAKAQLDRPGLALQQPAQGSHLVRRRARRGPGGTGRHRVTAADHEAQQPLAALQEPVQAVAELARIDDAQQLEIVALEHDAVIGGAPADMPAARRRVEPQPGVLRSGNLEIADPDDGMVDADDLAVQAATLLHAAEQYAGSGSDPASCVRRAALTTEGAVG